jgi:hypothetical protein
VRRLFLLSKINPVVSCNRLQANPFETGVWKRIDYYFQQRHIHQPAIAYVSEKTSPEFLADSQYEFWLLWLAVQFWLAAK